MSDKSTYVAIGVSLLLSLGAGTAAYGALDERVSNQRDDIDELKQDRREVNAKLDAILNLTARIAGRMEEQDRAEQRRRVREGDE